MKKNTRKPGKRVELSTEAISAKKQAAGRKGRGVDALTLKGDPDLQKRIDMVVAKALSGEGSTEHSVDVMFVHVLKRSNLMVRKLG